MSRLVNYLHSATSGHFALLANTAYTLMAVPLALTYLDTPGFGLWALASQANIYLSLLDLGTTPTITRLLIDHKDQKETAGYGSMVKTGSIILMAQGLLVLCAGIILPTYCAALIGVPVEATKDFALLLQLLAGIQAITFATKIFTQLLEAHQKQFICNYITGFGFAAGFLAMSLGFSNGLGVFSMVLASATQTLITITGTCVAANLQKLIPDKARRGSFSTSSFREIFMLSRDTFLMVVGSSIIMGGQTIIIGRYMGLTAAAGWAIGTRVFFLLSQFLWRQFDSSLPALGEMLTRGESLKLEQRFSDLLRATAVTAVAAAGCLALTNTSFVAVWCSKRLAWTGMNDILLSIWLVILTVAHCHSMLILATKKVRLMKYIFLLEGITSMLLASVVIGPFGIPGVILASIACSLLLHFPYALWRTMHFLPESFPAISRNWSWPAMRSALTILPVISIAWYATRSISDGEQLAWRVAASGLVGIVIILTLGLSDQTRVDLTERLHAYTERLRHS